MRAKEFITEDRRRTRTITGDINWALPHAFKIFKLNPINKFKGYK